MTRASLPTRSGSRLRALIAACAAAIALGTGLACDRNALGPKEVGPDGRALGRIAVVVPVGNQQATAVTVTVSAVDIPIPMSFNFPIVGGVAAGSIAVPAGSGRLITVSAFDGSVETHRGTTTLTINAGTNPTTSITLVPLAGTVPITATFGTVVITVTPATASPKVGDTLRFNATIRDATGTIVPGPARWASTNTAKLVIDTAGLTTVLDTGSVNVVATYSTSAAIAALTNQPATGGPTPAFLRTWVGGSGTGQNRNRWDVANNWTPAFVPTANDSVVIAAAAFQPIIPVDTFAVRDLILRTGATLDAFCCGIRLRVAHVASGEGGTFGPSITGLLMRNGAVVQGTLPANINMGPAVSASLSDSARIGSLTVDGAAASFDLAGKRLVVTGNLFVNNGGLLRVDRAADTLDVGAQFQITNSAAAHLGALTAGTIIFRGVNNYFDGFQASGTNTVVFQPAIAGAQNVYSMNYTSVAANAFQNVVVAPTSTANICAYVRVQGSLTVQPGSPGLTSCSSYYLKVEGPMTTPSGSAVTGTMYVMLAHPSGTANIGGAWSPSYTDFLAPGQTVKGGLGYQNVRFFASQTLVDTVAVAGSLQVDGASTVMAITAPRRIVVGSLNLTNSGTFTLDQPGDTLEVRGDLNTNSGGNSLGKLTDGVAVVWGNLYGGQYSGTGNNTVIMAGTTTQQFFYSFNPSATPATGLQNVRIAGTAGANICSTVQVSGFFQLTTATTLASCSSYNLIINGALSTVVGSNVTTYQVQLANAAGTANVLGTWSPGYTDVIQPNVAIKPGLSYQNLRFFATDTLPSGSFRIFQHLTVDGLSTMLAFKGTKFQVDSQVTIQNNARIAMANGDTLSLGGNLNWYSTNFSQPTGGQINAGGQYLNLNGYQPSGTAKIKLVGTTVGQHLNTTDPVNRPLVRLEMANPFGMILDGSIAVADTFAVTASGPNANVVSGYYYDLEVRGAFVTVPGSSVYPRVLNLAGSSTLNNVNGALAPGILRLYSSVPGALRNAPGYQFSNVEFYTAYQLTDTLTTTINTIAYAGPYTGNVSVNNNGTVLDLNGKRTRLAGGFDANTLAILKMTNAADSLLLGDGSNSPSGYLYLDGGTGTASSLTAGTIVLRGNTNIYNANFGSGHTLVFTDSGLAVTPRTYQINGNSGQTLGSVVIRGSNSLTVQPNTNWTLLGGFDLRAGPTFFGPYYYTWHVSGPVTTAAGSSVTAAANVNFIMELADPTGTANVSGVWSPSTTRFTANLPTVKTTLGYQSLDFAASTTIPGPLNVTGNINAGGGTLAFGANHVSMGGSLSASGASTVLALGQSQVSVGLDFSLGAGATLSMQSNNDTLNVFRNFNSDNGANNSTVTAGVIRVHGNSFTYRLNPTGTSWFVLDTLTSGAVQDLNTNNQGLNRLRVETARGVQISSSITFTDSVIVASPTVFGYPSGYTGYTQTFNGPFVSVAGSTVNGGTFQLNHASGTANVSGSWLPNLTVVLNPAAVIKPTLGYQNFQCNASCTFSGPTTIAGNFSAYNGSTVVGTNGNRIAIGGYLQLQSGSILRMTLPSDSLLIAGAFTADNGSNNSNLTDGVIKVKGDVNAYRLGASGNSKLVLDSAAGATQNFYTNNGAVNIVEVRTNRNINFTSSVTFNGAFGIFTPVSAATGSNLAFNAPVSSVAGSNLSASVITLVDPSYANNLVGSLSTANELQLASPSGGTWPVAPRFTYGTVRIVGQATVPTGVSAFTGRGSAPFDLYVDPGATLFIQSGATVGVCRNVSIASSAAISNLGTISFNQTSAGVGATQLARIVGVGTQSFSFTCP